MTDRTNRRPRDLARRALYAAPKRAAAALLALAAAACAAPPPPETAMVADFDAPRPRSVASLLMAANHRSAVGDLEGALHAAEDARHLGPTSAAAALREAELRGELARRRGDAQELEAAYAEIEGLAQAYPDEPAPRMALARIALADRRKDEAIAAARRVASERPDWAAAHALLARALVEEDPTGAAAEAARAVELAPADQEALGARALTHVALAEYSDAVDDARRALRRRPDPDVTLALATALLQTGDPHGAVEQVESVLEADRAAALELPAARAQRVLHDGGAARAALDRAKQRAAGDATAEADVLALRAELEASEGHGADAVALVDAARDARPDDARLQELAALTELRAERLPEARASARRAVELAPERPIAWQVLAEASEEGAAKAPARQRALEALGGADGARVDALAGMIAENTDRAAARSAYEAALSRAPEQPVVQLRLARLLASQGHEPERAVALAESARKAIGWTRETGETLGGALLAADRPNDAITPFKIAAAHIPPGSAGGEAIALDLAQAYAATGRTDRARALVAALLARPKQEGHSEPWREPAEALAKQLSPKRERNESPEAKAGTESRAGAERKAEPEARSEAGAKPADARPPEPKPGSQDARPDSPAKDEPLPEP